LNFSPVEFLDKGNEMKEVKKKNNILQYPPNFKLTNYIQASRPFCSVAEISERPNAPSI
jgi:hypothetical protein